MTVVTGTTIGLREVSELDDAEQSFSISLAIGAVDPFSTDCLPDSGSSKEVSQPPYPG